jgi:sugar phosphate isomerase/epimerase
MKLGITAWTFEGLQLPDCMALCKALGFRRVDIAGFHQRGMNSLEPDAVAQEPAKFADLLKRATEPHELTVQDYFPAFGSSLEGRALNHPDLAERQKNRESMRGILKFCQMVGIPGITLSPGILFPQLSFEQNIQTSINEFKYFVQLAEGTGVTIRVEPHMHAIADTPERTLWILQEAPGTKVTLDYAHFLIQYISMERAHLLLPYTDHIHVRQSRMGKMQTRTEEGTIDYSEVIARLKAFQYHGVFSLEYVNMDWFDCNQVDTMMETIKTTKILSAWLEK